jgi:hypothetical protein
VKPHIISCIGDIAMAIGAEFAQYMEPVGKILQVAAHIKKPEVGLESRCSSIFIFISIYIYMCVCVCVCMHVCAHVCMNLCICVPSWCV